MKEPIDVPKLKEANRRLKAKNRDMANEILKLKKDMLILQDTIEMLKEETLR